MPDHSAGIVLYRQDDHGVCLFLVHPGGPFWKNKDTAAWSIPKGVFDPEAEDAERAARREFSEETGLTVEAALTFLGTVRTSGKVIHVFLAEGDADPDSVTSNTFTMAWPPRSGREQEFPEVDKAGWFALDTAKDKLHKGQRPIVDMVRHALEDEA